MWRKWRCCWWLLETENWMYGTLLLLRVTEEIWSWLLRLMWLLSERICSPLLLLWLLSERICGLLLLLSEGICSPLLLLWLQSKRTRALLLLRVSKQTWTLLRLLLLLLLRVSES